MLMQDMFSGQLTAPADEPDYSDGFDAFWKAWPSGARKIGKPQALAKWMRFKWSNSAAHIIAHVAWLKTQPDWLKDGGAFVCAPCVYLNQQRWLDWTPPEKPPVDPVAATRALFTERDRTAAPMPASVREKLATLRKGVRS